MEHQEKKTANEDKPVGYGSSIQSSGNGNQSRPPQPADKNQLIEDEGEKLKEDSQQNDDE